MKKNKYIKIASALLILCLVTTCAISATFAKYATESSSSDTARVAKWGVEVSASGTLFGKNYGANQAAEYIDSIMAATSASVSTSGADKVVAPGTKNDIGVKIIVKGTPEVSYVLDVSTASGVNSDIFLKAGEYGVMVPAHGLNGATDFTAGSIFYLDGTTYKVADLTYFNANPTASYYQILDRYTLSADYFPVEWKAEVDGNAAAIAATTAVGIYDAIADELDGLSGDANEELNYSYVITWEWAIDNDSAADTILGNIMSGANVVVAGTDGFTAVTDANYCTDIGFDITINATQVD